MICPSFNLLLLLPPLLALNSFTSSRASNTLPRGLSQRAAWICCPLEGLLGATSDPTRQQKPPRSAAEGTTAAVPTALFTRQRTRHNGQPRLYEPLAAASSNTGLPRDSSFDSSRSNIGTTNKGVSAAASARAALQAHPIFPFTEMESTLLQWWESESLFEPMKLTEETTPEKAQAAEPRRAATEKCAEGVKAFCMAPPNLTGSLHAGHFMSLTIEDVLFRFQRQREASAHPPPEQQQKQQKQPQQRESEERQQKKGEKPWDATPHEWIRKQQQKQQSEQQVLRSFWVPGVDHAGMGLQLLLERHISKRIKKGLYVPRCCTRCLRSIVSKAFLEGRGLQLHGQQLRMREPQQTREVSLEGLGSNSLMQECRGSSSNDSGRCSCSTLECEQHLGLLQRWLRICWTRIQQQQRSLGLGCWWASACCTVSAAAVSLTRQAFVLLQERGLLRRQLHPLQALRGKEEHRNFTVVVPNELLEVKETHPTDQQQRQQQQQKSGGGEECEEELLTSLLQAAKWEGGLFVELPIRNGSPATNSSHSSGGNGSDNDASIVTRSSCSKASSSRSNSPRSGSSNSEGCDGTEELQRLLVPVGSLQDFLQVCAVVTDDSSIYHQLKGKQASVPLLQQSVPVLLQERGDRKHPHVAAASQHISRCACSSCTKSNVSRSTKCHSTNGCSSSSRLNNDRRGLLPAFAALQWEAVPGRAQLATCVAAALRHAVGTSLQKQQQQQAAREKALLAVLLLTGGAQVHLGRQQPGELVSTLNGQATVTRAKPQWFFAADRVAPRVVQLLCPPQNGTLQPHEQQLQQDARFTSSTWLQGPGTALPLPLPLTSAPNTEIESSSSRSASSTNNGSSSATYTDVNGLDVIPARYLPELLQQLQSDRTWCISRQGWWGVPVPAYLVRLKSQEQHQHLQQQQKQEVPLCQRIVAAARVLDRCHSQAALGILKGKHGSSCSQIRAKLFEAYSTALHELQQRQQQEQLQQESGLQRTEGLDAASASRASLPQLGPCCCSQKAGPGAAGDASTGKEFAVAALDEASARRKAVAFIRQQQRQQQKQHTQQHVQQATEFEILEDTDVLDTWFSSGLWPLTSLVQAEETFFKRYGAATSRKHTQEQQQQPLKQQQREYPKVQESGRASHVDSALFDYQEPQQRLQEGLENSSSFLFPRLYPYSCLVTGHDILPFWVARQLLLCVALCGVLPLSRVVLHPLLTDMRGHKLSKSKGNAPKTQMDQWITQYGADALRFGSTYTVT